MTCAECHAETEALIERISEQLIPGKGLHCSDCVPLLTQAKLALMIFVRRCPTCEGRKDGNIT